MFEEGPTQTVLQSRRRHRRVFKQPKDDKWAEKDRSPVTKDQVKAMKLNERGSILGVMFAQGYITAQERTAGEDYCDRYGTYAQLSGLPKPTAKGASWGGAGGRSNRQENISATIAAKAAHMADQRVLTQCSAGVTWAMKRACVRDEPATPHLVKEGLAALVRAGR